MIRRSVNFLGAACVTAAVTVSVSVPAEAQSIRQIARMVNCHDPNGERVTAVSHVGLPNVGMAGRVRGRPVIMINPMVLARFRPATRVFWYFHECAHHALGHSLGHQPDSRERDADCWAIRQMKRRGLLKGNRLRIVQADLRPLNGDGFLYLPGPQRAAHVGYCATGRRTAPRMARRHTPPPDRYAGRRVEEDGRLAARRSDAPSEGPIGSYRNDYDDDDGPSEGPLHAQPSRRDYLRGPGGSALR